MRRILIAIIVFISAINLSAQRKFDPNKFRMEIHQYIVTSANLTRTRVSKIATYLR